MCILCVKQAAYHSRRTTKKKNLIYWKNVEREKTAQQE
jgi:hypothetical protein